MLHCWLCSTCYTAVRIMNCLKSTSAIKIDFQFAGVWKSPGSGTLDIICGTLQAKLLTSDLSCGSSPCILLGSRLISLCQFQREAGKAAVKNWKATTRYMDKPLGWLRCCLCFSLLRSVIQCICGARSSIGVFSRTPPLMDLVRVESHLT